MPSRRPWQHRAAGRAEDLLTDLRGLLHQRGIGGAGRPSSVGPASSCCFWGSTGRRSAASTTPRANGCERTLGRCRAWPRFPRRSPRRSCLIWWDGCAPGFATLCSHLADLPPEAAQDQAMLRALNNQKSRSALPADRRGPTLGGLSFGTIRAEHPGRERWYDGLRLISGSSQRADAPHKEQELRRALADNVALREQFGSGERGVAG